MFLSLFARDTLTRSSFRRFFSRAYLSSWFATPLPLPPFLLSTVTLDIQPWYIIHEILLLAKQTSRRMLSGVRHLVLLGLNAIMEFTLLYLSKRVKDLPSRMEDVVDLIIAADNMSYKVVFEMIRQIGTWVRFAFTAAFHQCALRLEKAGIMETGEYYLAEEDFRFAFTCTYQGILLLRRDNRAIEHELDLVKADFERYKAENPAGVVEELGKKVVSLRRSHVESLSDQNFWKTQCMSQCNWRHNIINGVKPDGPMAEHPYRANQVHFLPEEDPETGLHYASNVHWVHNKGVPELVKEIDLMAPRRRGEPRRPVFVPNNTDPFANGGSVFLALFPGAHIPPIFEGHDPINIANKRVVHFKEPERRFGKQIEDAAASGGSMAYWDRMYRPLRSSSYEAPVTAIQNINRLVGRPVGNSRPAAKKLPRTKSMLPNTPPAQPYALLPGEPMSISPIRW